MAERKQNLATAGSCRARPDVDGRSSRRFDWLWFACGSAIRGDHTSCRRPAQRHGVGVCPRNACAGRHSRQPGNSDQPGPAQAGRNQTDSAPAGPHQPSPVQAAATASPIRPLRPSPRRSRPPRCKSLPASGRRWEEFVLDTPAAAAATGSSQVSLRRLGQQPADITVDGASIRLAYGSGASSSPGASGQPTSAAGLSEPNGMGQAWAGGRGLPLPRLRSARCRPSPATSRPRARAPPAGA